MEKVIPIVMEKNCGSCTACCSGVLTGNAYGHNFWRGRPCFFVQDTGCSIYENRPDNPCKSYRCGFLELDWMPLWMRPDKSGVIITRRARNNIEFVEILETSGKIRSEILNYIYISYLENRIKNMIIQVDGGFNYIGTPEFLDEFGIKKN